MDNKKHLNEGSNIRGNSGNVFGFDATILLFLKNARVCNYLSVEDADDIRLSFKDNKGDLFAQAKSSFASNQLYELDHYSEVFKSYKSFQRVVKDKRNNAREFSIVFNYRKPFGDGEIVFGPEIGKYKKYNYNDLPNSIKQKLVEKYDKKKYSFDLGKTSFTYIYYEGDETARNQFIIDEILAFVNAHDLDINPSNLYSAWFEMVSRSSTHSTNRLSVNNMIGSAFVAAIKPSDLLKASKSLFEDFYPFEESLLKKEIRDYLANKELDFSTITQIKSSFFAFYKANMHSGMQPKEMYLKFANYFVLSNSLPMFVTELFKNETNKKELQKAFYKAVVYYVINQQDMISALEEAFGYED